MIRALVLTAALLLAAPGTGSAALAPDEVLDDPVLEERARALGKELRCVVCQNQAIDDSNAELAQDLRRLVRERLVAGDSDQEILDYMVARYGDFVLLKPPVTSQTMLLWGGPFAVLLLGGGLIVWSMRNRRTAIVPDELSAEEQEQLAEALKQEPRSL